MNLSKQKETLLLIMWTQSLIAVLGSLYYSEIVGYIPCELCWIQRIFMYPLVIIFGVALIKRNILKNADNFCGEVPCNLQYINYFGFITIPFLAGSAFLVILITSYFLYKR